ncbi:MAG: RpiB/LacA/LacB family sugar-phosphate isomerase [Oscillospiraceae bacterium]|nr:RpiB/LacA/LacB family sugar-phosphate isomerase [Oscillospiraceae bacterium]
MKIALINENSQAPKNELIFETLKKAAEPLGHECFNYGRYSAEDPHERTYVQEGLLAAILLNSGAADFVITGCGTGMGAMLALNSFPGVMCGWAHEPLEAYLFAQVNAGNALSMPFAMDFGWGAEVNLQYMFERLLGTPMGAGYPEAWAGAEKRNRGVLAEVKKVTHTDIMTVLKNIDQDFLKGAIAEPTFPELFFPNCKDEAIADYIRSVLA